MTIHTPIETPVFITDSGDSQDRLSYHWTPTAQRRFLEVLAETGNVHLAAAEAFKSPRAAYKLRHRDSGAAFRLGWDAAILIARARLSDELMMRAIEGQSDTIERDEHGRNAGRHRRDNRLAMGMLTRLDRMCDAPAAGTEHALARIVSQDFEAFLDLIAIGGAGAEAALFVAARKPADPVDAESNGHCELCRNSADEEAVPDAPPPPPVNPVLDYIETLSVWWDEHRESWRTDFPPPDGFEGEQRGRFGHDFYSRTLTPEEIARHEAMLDDECARLAKQADVARRLWFGLATLEEVSGEIAAAEPQPAKTETVPDYNAPDRAALESVD